MNICQQLHELLRKGKKFKYDYNSEALPKNGIYIFYETKETGHDGDRIVRIGINRGNNNFRKRLKEHFEGKKNRSIFRKNIGKVLLNKKNDPYLTIWGCDYTSKEDKNRYKKYVEDAKEESLEKEISAIIQNDFYFVVLNIDNKKKREEFEKKLIGTVSNCNKCKASENWRGNNSPECKIFVSGLWQVQHLYTQGLLQEELAFVEKCLIK